MSTEKTDTQPFEHPAFATFRGSSKYLAARDRTAITGESIEEALNALALDAIRDGQGKPVGIISRLASALKGEKTAREELDKALALRAEAAALNKQWEEFLGEHAGISLRIANAEQSIDSIKRGVADVEEHLANHIGTSNGIPTHAHLVALLQDAASASAGIPFAQRAVEKAREKLRAHVAQMIAWGSKNGVPKETLAGLPESAR